MNHPSRISRNIDGVILMDKPRGWSSNNFLQKVRHLFLANKAGHTGTLDPLATGMLPICFGKATKYARYLLDADKHYQVTAQLGVRTTTYDAEGKIISIRPVMLNQAHLESALNDFLGNIYQIPPMFSSIKYQGRPLYTYARQGLNIPRVKRMVHVYSLKLMHWNQIHQIKLDIHCSKGTYIRTIIDDLGERLGCGAHIKDLRRLAVSPYSNMRMITLEELKTLSTTVELKSTTIPEMLSKLDALLLPVEKWLKVYQL